MARLSGSLSGFQAGYLSGGGSPAGDTTGPVKTGISVNAAGTTVTVTYNEPMAGGTTTTQWVVTGCAFAVTCTVAVASGSSMVLTVSPAILSTDTPLLAYTSGADPAKDLSDNNAANFTATAITNNSTQTTTIVAMFGSGGDGTLRAFYPDETASIATGTDTTGSYRIADIPNHANASLGGTVAQGTAANQPAFGWLKGGVYANTYHADSGGSELIASVAASGFKPIHQFPCTLFFCFRTQNVGVTQHLINTQATPGSGTGVGATVTITSGAVLRIRVADGTTSQSIEGATVLANTFYTAIVRLNAGETADWFINGAAGLSEALVITPSSSDPGAALNIGVGTAGAGYNGLLAGVGFIEKYASNAEIAAIHADLAGRYGLTYASLAEIVTDASLQEIDWGWDYNVSGPNTLIGAVAQTPVNTPTYATDAAANSKYVATLAAASSQYFTINGVAASLSGTDKTYGFLAVQKVNDTAANKTLFAADHSTGNGYKKFDVASTEVLVSAVRDNVSSTDTNTDTNTVPLTYTLVSCSHFGTSTNMTLGMSLVDNTLTQDVGALSVDIASIGATRPLGVAATFFDGTIACSLLAIKGFNPAKVFILEPGLRAEYGGSWT